MDALHLFLGWWRKYQEGNVHLNGASLKLCDKQSQNDFKPEQDQEQQRALVRNLQSQLRPELGGIARTPPPSQQHRNWGADGCNQSKSSSKQQQQQWRPFSNCYCDFTPAAVPDRPIRALENQTNPITIPNIKLINWIKKNNKSKIELGCRETEIRKHPSLPGAFTRG